MLEQESQSVSQSTESAAGQSRSLVALFQQWGLLLIVAGVVIGIDQTAKMLVTSRLLLGQSWEPIPEIAGLVRITYSQNTGAALGMLSQASNAILVVAIVAIVVFVISYPKLPTYAWLSRLGVAMIIGGAVSNNALDRLRLGYVTDYVHVRLTPTFSNVSNFADHAIVVGAALLMIDLWMNDRHKDPTQKAEPVEMTGSAATSP